jgi:hypothetical protein
MRLLLNFSILFMFQTAIGQNEKANDSTSFYISRLNWNSFSISWNYAAEFHLEKDAINLIQLNDSLKLKMLLESIDDSTKTVTIHAILSKIFEPKNSSFKVIYKHPNETSREVIGVDLIFNSLIWSGNEIEGYRIKNSEITRIKKYWMTKLNIKSP